MPETNPGFARMKREIAEIIHKTATDGPDYGVEMSEVDILKAFIDEAVDRLCDWA